MSAALRKPVQQGPQAASEGPRLVPPRQAGPSQVSMQEIERADPHPLAGALIIGGIALIGAITFAGTVLSWLLLRGTGVNWMFQGVSGVTTL